MPHYLADRITLDQGARRMTPEGFLDVMARISRSGVYQYFAFELGDLMNDRDPFAIVSVYRSPEEVFADAAMSSFKKKPVTEGHPWEMVTASNVRQVQVGLSGEDIRRDGDFMSGTLLIQDAGAVNRVQRGEGELSAGYYCDLVREAGTHDGQPYEVVQRNIRGNHIALVDRGRCGALCKVDDRAPSGLRDHATAIIDCSREDRTPMTTPATALAQISYDGFSGMADANGQMILRKVTADLDAARKANETQGGELAALRKSIEDIKAEHAKQLDAAKAEVPNAAALDAMVAARVKLIGDAKRILGDSFDASGKDNAAIRAAVVQAKMGEAGVRDRAPAYIEAAFDTIVAQAGESTTQQTQTGDGLGQVVAASGQAGPATGAMSAYDKMLADMKNAYKPRAAA